MAEDKLKNNSISAEELKDFSVDLMKQVILCYNGMNPHPSQLVLDIASQLKVDGPKDIFKYISEITKMYDNKKGPSYDIESRFIELENPEETDSFIKRIQNYTDADIIDDSVNQRFEEHVKKVDQSIEDLKTRHTEAVKKKKYGHKTPQEKLDLADEINRRVTEEKNQKENHKS